MAVSKRLRYEILRRDNHTCRYCGGSAPDVVLTVGHVVPTALGGGDEPTNLVAACKDCNAGKTSSSPDAPLVEDVADKAVQWGAAIQRWAKQRINDRYERDCYVDQFSDAWGVWGYGPEDDRKQVPKPAGWKATIWQFYETGLPIEELEDAITISCGRDRVQLDEKFRYMCGIAWKQVEKMQEESQALLEEPVDTGDSWADLTPDAMRVYRNLSLSDEPYEMLAGHVDGTESWLGHQMRWVA